MVDAHDDARRAPNGDAPRNGNGNPSITGAISSISRSLVGALPPAFIAMLCLNVAFLALVGWFVDHQMAQRTALADKILSACLAHIVK